MAITITTLANNAAVAKTFTEIGKDRNSAEWYNATDDTASFHNFLTIKQRIGRKNAIGIPVRETLVQFTAEQSNLVEIGVGTTPLDATEVLKINVTIQSPTSLQALTATNRADIAAFMRNFMTAANVEALVLGQV